MHFRWRARGGLEPGLVPPTPLVLLPPSEGKAPGGDGPPWAPGGCVLPEVDGARRKVMAALAAAAKAPEADRAKLFGVKGEALAEATRAAKQVRRAPTMAAIERYSGVLYGALDAGSLSARDRKRLDAQVLVVSGLFGVVAPNDPIPPYKLKMGASLPSLGKLSTFWRPHLDAHLTPLTERRTVWNLLPNEHAAAWSGPTEGSGTTEVVVRFLDDVVRGGQRRLVTVSHWNKLLKGALVRHVLAHQLHDPEGLADFRHPEGYVFRPDLTEVSGGRTTVSLVARRSS